MHPPLASPLVAIVDSDSHARDQLSGLLVRQGFSVQALHSAEELLTGDVRPGCIVASLPLVGMTGWEMADAMEARSRPPIVFLADAVTAELRVRASAMRGCRVLARPVQSEELVLALVTALSRTARQAMPRDRGFAHCATTD